MDKARRLYPLAIKFSEGEQPSAAKLTGISTQAKNALGIVELMLGDIWNQAGDAVLSPGGTPTINALHIPNIARSIGKLDLINSMLPGTNAPLSSSMIYIDDVGTLYGGKNRGYLKYKPALTPSSVTMILGGTFAPLIQGAFASDPVAMTSVTEWSVDAEGKIYTLVPIPSTMTIQYVPQVISDVSDLNASTASWNVIPDPTTWSGNYAGVKISLANNVDTSLGFHIWLPPRKPLDSTKIIRQSPTTTSNISASPNGGTLLFFQDPTAVASTTNADHYRYNFPKELTVAGGSGDTLPAGFIYIWDETTGTIIDGATFFVPGTSADRKFKIRATGANLITVFGSTIGNGIITDDTTQIATDYISRFKIITVGASLSKSLSYLNKNFWTHKHKPSEGHQPISHADLDNMVTPGWDATYNTIYPSGTLAFRKTSWQNDDHSQYLHRAGSTMSFVGGPRDRHDNCVFRMIGVKSPFSTDFAGRANLSVADDGLTAHLNAAEFTNLIIGGTAWPVNLDKVQVNSKLYFSQNGSPSIPLYALSLNNITYTEIDHTYTFIANGATATSTISAGTVNGNHMHSANEIIATTDMIIGGDIDASTRQGSYLYNSSRYQYFNIDPASIMLSAANQAAGLTYNNGRYIINDDTGSTHTIIIPVRLPNGAIMTAGQNITVWSAGNGVAGLLCTLVSLDKPTIAGWTSLSQNVIRSAFSAGSVTTTTITTVPYDSTFTGNNSFTGTYCQFIITFPIKIASDASKLYGITLQYRMSQVDN